MKPDKVIYLFQYKLVNFLAAFGLMFASVSHLSVVAIVNE